MQLPQTISRRSRQRSHVPSGLLRCVWADSADSPGPGSLPPSDNHAEAPKEFSSLGYFDTEQKQKIAEAGLEELLKSSGNSLISPDVVLQVVLLAFKELDSAGREWVLRELQTPSQHE